MIGYHYTSLDNWRVIKKQGLVPYDIIKPELFEICPYGACRGIWLWKFRLYGVSHAGSVLFQMAKKGVTKVVMLKVKYELKNCLYGVVDGVSGYAELAHSGTFDNLKFHNNTEKARIVIRPISPDKIKLIAVYNLATAWR